MPHQDTIHRAQGRRLHQLEMQQAYLGLDTPPQIAMEIADLQAAGVISESFETALTSLARHADRGMVAALIMSCLALVLAVADFVLILVLRGA